MKQLFTICTIILLTSCGDHLKKDATVLSEMKSPVIVIGKSPETWYEEGSATVKDSNGKVLICTGELGNTLSIRNIGDTIK